MMAGDPLGFSVASAQTTTETSSSGDLYMSEDTSETVTGSTLYSAEFQTEINGESGTIPLTGLLRYFDRFDDAEIQQAAAAQLPAEHVHMVGDVPVTIVSWSPAELVESNYEVIDTFTSETPYSTVSSVVTTQLTSGDGPDNVVPTGYRSDCYSFGANGATNFEPFGGSFADCSGGEEFFEVAPGTVNSNTHTTTVYTQGTRYVESVDEGYFDRYVLRPRESLSASSGTLATTIRSATTVRTDSYETRIMGMVGDTNLFDTSQAGAFTDAAVQAAIVDLSKPRGYAIGGAPVVVTWSAPVRVASSEQLLSSSVDTQTSTRRFDAVTITTTNGGMAGGEVLIGDRGTCTDTGTGGATNGASPTGAFATCDGGVTYTLASGETNTNIHTTDVTETTISSVTTENWLNSETYRLAGTPVAIGQIHAALRDVLYGGDFERRHADAIAAALPRGGERRFGLWALARTGRDTSKSDAAGAGSRRTTRGGSGGLAIRLSEAAQFGLAIDYGKTDVALAGLAEKGEARLTQIGLGAELSPGIWRIRLAAGHGWGSISTERGSDAMGGISRAGYDASLWSAFAEAGPEFAIGDARIQPLVGIAWTRAKLGGFAESGGIALEGGSDSATRLAVSFGARGELQRRASDGSGFRLSASLRGTRVADGRGRVRGVAFIGTPGQLLHVTSAREGGLHAVGEIGAAYYTAGGVGFHLGADGAAGSGDRSWRATGGISIAF
ncbi:hypothetical protein ATM17_15630 [Sphingopyxis macrogoltabida]|uniref:Autotransporter domain-containing protein n=1 Tax=Sphingopyxis macrogoltabida TaxID=33050 RepID=A0AAC9FFS6_SPHMC|nr:hypothetical protein ATM17_15630 [Sphingopyxis macrogoltabida]